MKKLLALLIVSVIMIPAFAQVDSIPDLGSISGFVGDADTGLPIYGAHVVAQGPGYGQAYTGSGGTYQITSLNPGAYLVTASAAGYEPAAEETVIVVAGQNTPDINFWLVPSGVPDDGSISGFVGDANTGLPILGCHVVAQGPDYGQTYTDSGGTYHIINLTPGPYSVTASAQGYEPGVQCSVLVIAGQNTPGIDFWLNPSGGTPTGISGRITNVYSSQPILGALVTAIASDSVTFGQDHTNYYGEYFIQNLAPGFYHVSASASGFEPAVYPELVEVVEDQITSDIDFALVPLDTFELGGISGLVTDASDGTPIVFAQVYAFGTSQGQASSDTSGYYLVNDLVAGEYIVRATAPGYYPATYPDSVFVIAGQITSGINFALTPSDTGGIGGFVIDGETWLTISGANVIATGSAGSYQAQTNSQGDYLIDDLQHGIYYIEVQASGYEPCIYSDAILVQSGWIEAFVCPVLYPSLSVEEQKSSHGMNVALFAYPCPFKKSSQLSFCIDKQTRTQIRVFDARGSVVRDLFDATIEPGLSYSITWDGKDNNGRIVPKGVYFYKLETDKTSITKKTIFLK
jgi:hypothetical protein